MANNISKFLPYLLIGLGVGGLGISLWLMWRTPTIPLKESIASASLPLLSNSWKQIELEESSNFSTYALELQHGWLIYRQSSFGAGMAFVPRPDMK